MTATDFDAIVTRYGSRIYGYIVYYLGTKQGADDVLQEVFIRLWNRRDSVDQTRVLAWLITVARNVCIDEHRRNRYHQRNVLLDTDTVEVVMDHENRQPDSIVENRIFMSELQDEVDKLDDPFRSIVILREIQGFKYEEIAEALELPLSTIKVYLHRARKKLRERLSARLELSDAKHQA